MAKNKRKIDMAMEKQMSLFDMLEKMEAQKRQGPQPGSLDMSAQVREGLSAALKNSPFKRWEIAGRMGEYAGAEITESMLNAWTADSKEGHRFPLEYLAAFSWATGDNTVTEIVAHGCGCYLTQGREIVLLKMAQIDDAARNLQREKERFMAYMEKMDQQLAIG